MNKLSKAGIAGGVLSLTAFSVQAAYQTANLYWRNTLSGDNYFHQVQNGSVLNFQHLNSVPVQWTLKGACDFNADGNDDLFWRDAISGQTAIYLMQNSQVQQNALAVKVADTQWDVAGLGDFNGDGRCDVFWRNSQSGKNHIHLMDGATKQQNLYLNTVAASGWFVAAVDDFNADGTDDVLWRNSSTGLNYLYTMKNGATQSKNALSTVPASDWMLAGSGDLNNDGAADLVWRNTKDGQNYAHLMSAGKVSSVVKINSVPDQNWKISAIVDLNADGKSDLFWHNQQTGQNYIYFMNGAAVSGTQSFESSSDLDSVLAATATAINSTTMPTVTGISVTPTQVTLQPQQTQLLSGTVTYSDNTSESIYNRSDLSWTTSNPQVVTVQNGSIAAVAAGDAVVSAQVGNYKATVTVHVEDEPVVVDSVSITPASLDLTAGESYQINSVTVSFSDGSQQTVSGTDLTWNSSNVSVATVNAGLVSALSEGASNISTSYQGVASNAVAVTVSPDAPDKNIVYFENNEGWSNVNIYFWGPTPTGAVEKPAWPGLAMKDLGNGWFSYEFPLELQSASVIFNDGDSQSDDLTFNTGSACYNGNWAATCLPMGGVSVSTTPGASNFQDQISITLNVSGDDITVSRYVVNKNGAELDAKLNGTDFVDGQIITVGSDIAENESLDVCLYAANAKKEASQCFTYTKKPVITDPLGRCEIPEYSGNPHGSFDAMKEKFQELRIYQVMVESFVDGDPNHNYGTGYGPSHHSGDLVGIKKSLPYMKALGANAVWMTPIFDSEGGGKLDATGYFTRNYYKIDPKFGTEQQFRDLVEEAHNLGMYVILDGVFGHHKGSVPTNDCGASPQGGNDPVSYPGSLEFYKDVATYWIKEYGIDGWRLDQAYQVPVQYWTEIRQAVESVSKYRKQQGHEWGTLGYMVGEIWKGENEIQATGYGPASQPGLYSNFEFPVRYSIVQTLAAQEHTDQAGASGRPASALADKLTAMLTSAYAEHAIPNLMLTNHDLVRFGDLLQRAGYGGKESADYWNRHKAAIGFMSVFSGPITIYYGDEVGDEVGGFVNQGDRGFYDDHVSRSSGNVDGVTTTLGGNEKDLKDFTASVMNLRAQHPAMWKGERTHLDSGQSIYADLKVSGSDRVVFVMNAYNQSETLSLDASTVGGTQLVDMLSGETVSAQGGKFNLQMSGIGIKLFSVQ